MADLIIYSPKRSEIKKEAEGLADTVDEQGQVVKNPLKKLFHIANDGVTFAVTKTPTRKYVDESLSIVRGVDRAVFKKLKNLKVLGEIINKEYVFDTLGNKNIYERLHDRTPVETELEDGSTVTYTPPYQIGGFL